MGVGPGLCERLELLVAPAPSHKPFGYESRSFRSPFFSLALPFLWSERPSLFLLLSPLRAPPASFIRPLALSIAPSFLSRLLRFVPTVRSLLLSQTASRYANPNLRASASRVIPPRLSPRSRRSRMSCSSSHLLLLPHRR